MNYSRASQPTGYPVAAWQQAGRIGTLGLIVLLHVGFFYALQSGLLRETAQAQPKEMIATFITPVPATAPPAPVPKPQPATPKTAPAVKRTVAAPRPTAPVVKTTPSPQAIAAPPAPPAASEPAAASGAEPSAPALPGSASVSVSVSVSASTPTASAQPRIISSGIEYIQAPQPQYPPIAKRMGEQGKTVLRVLVNEKGRPERVEVQQSSGSARLDEAARQAVLRALFKPFVDDGKALAAYAIVPIRFQLDN